jgi:5'-deoxynucleotidase YfbR-like HD superfamily hydrolase
MAKKEPIWARAREDLVIDFGQGQEDVFLWEHTERVTRTTAQIAARAPELRGNEVDLQVLTAAALYHDAGWIVQLRDEAVARTGILCSPLSDLQRDLGASLMEQRLAGLLPAGVLRRAGECIRQLQRRDVAAPEAQILYDADTLDQVGTLVLCRLLRRYGFEGKGLQAFLDTWKSQQEYGYWKARLESFRFASVRKLAEGRFAALKSYMSALLREHDGDDLGQPPPDAGGAETPAPTGA